MRVIGKQVELLLKYKVSMALGCYLVGVFLSRYFLVIDILELERTESKAYTYSFSVLYVELKNKHVKQVN